MDYERLLYELTTDGTQTFEEYKINLEPSITEAYQEKLREEERYNMLRNHQNAQKSGRYFRNFKRRYV